MCTKNTYLLCKYNGLVARRGKKRVLALVAVERKRIIAAYFILKNKESHKELGGNLVRLVPICCNWLFSCQTVQHYSKVKQPEFQSTNIFN
jgi:hypothetical protein